MGSAVKPAVQPNCPYCNDKSVKAGQFVRHLDARRIQKYRCKGCRKYFSNSHGSLFYRHKKRRLHWKIRDLMVAGVSERRMAKILGISRTTVVRKIRLLDQIVSKDNFVDLAQGPMVSKFQFDDLETIEHTKLKPLSVTMAVEKTSRRILGFEVSQMPAKGLLAKRSIKKYGYRKDMRARGRDLLFEAIKEKVLPTATIESDESPHNPKSVKRWFPKATHLTTPGRRGCVVGQGELKAEGFDPLFSLNHTFAMLRANINRLFRRTWCTTKLPSRLAAHIRIYLHYHNRQLISA